MSEPLRLITNDFMTKNKTQTGHCEQHGQYEQAVFSNMPPSCPQCFVEKKAMEDEQRQLEQKKRRQEIALKAAGIPPRFRDKDFSNYALGQDRRQQEVFNALSNYCRNFSDNLRAGRSVIMCGMPGTGKTHLAFAMIKSVLDHGYRALMIDAYDCILRIKKTWSREAEEDESHALRDLIAYDLLVLDEVGVQFGSEAEKMILFRLLNKRYEQLKPVVVISNLKLDELIECLGSRIYDRLRENGGVVSGFNWKSHRG